MTGPDGAPARERLSVAATTFGMYRPIGELAEVCGRHGITQITVWPENYADVGVAGARRCLRDAGVRVDTYCALRGLGSAVGAERAGVIETARRGLATAVELGARAAIIAGSVPQGTTDFADCRARLAEGIAEILPDARSAGVMLMLEALHPMLADQASITTTKVALAMAESLGQGVGLLIDTYHTWWDPEIETLIAAAGRRIAGLQVSDWLVPTRDLLYDRGMIGDGIIDIPRLRGAVDAAGYSGPIEIEVFSRDNWWKREPDEVARTIVERFAGTC